MRQAEDYAAEISRSGSLTPNAEIICYVLGTSIEVGTLERKIGHNEQIKIFPRTYEVLLHQANARTFNLKQRIDKAKATSADEEMNKVLLISNGDVS